MSASFYHLRSAMGGMDVHMVVPLAPTPTGDGPGIVPIPFVVGVPFVWACALNKVCTTVSSDGWAMLQGGFDLYLVPHIPTTPPPGLVIGNLMWLKLVLGSGSKAMLQAHSVTNGGNALATCVFGGAGMNVNCNDPFQFPNGAVGIWSSVKTTPTIGDYIGAMVGYVVDSAYGYAVNKVTAPGDHGPSFGGLLVQHVIRRASDLVGLDEKELGITDPWVKGVAQYFTDPGGLGQNLVQKNIDSLAGNP
jgi:hypothetical protein